MADQPELEGLPNDVRHAVQDLVERASRIRTSHADEARAWAVPGPNLYLSWSEPRALEELPTETLEDAEAPVPGADVVPVVRAQREVTLTIRCDAYYPDTIAEHVLSRLSDALDAQGWREELRLLGFTYAGQLGRVVSLPLKANGAVVSSAALQIGLRYVSVYRDTDHATTWFERAEIAGTIHGALEDPRETVVETEPLP